MPATAKCSLIPNAADGDAVSGHEGHELERNDGVEGYGGAEVDERQEAADDAGKDHGIGWDS